MINCFDLEFYKGKRVLVTGHTGFKGTWLCKILLELGAEVTGYALEPTTKPSLFELINISKEINSVYGDIRDFNLLDKIFAQTKPEIVIHLAAQPIVRESYKNPRYTYETNVMGTVNILECVKNHSDSVKSFLNVTTDKVYKNHEWVWAYRENEELDGFDPYSNSKSCSELVTASYIRSFFHNDSNNVPISTARAGNVIGGGDFSVDRIIPDCVRAAINNEDIIVRNPYSVRPYQHVIEPLVAYLMICARQYSDNSYAGNYNIGPEYDNCISTGNLVDIFVNQWGNNIKRINKCDNGPHEANFLKLDCSKIKNKFGWQSKWSIDIVVKKIVEWTKAWQNGDDVVAIMEKQIYEYLEIK